MSKFFYKLIQLLLRFYYKTFMQIKVSGREIIPKEGGAIVCSNHKSFNDPIIIGAYVPRRMKYVAKAELFKIKPVGAFLRSMGAVAIDRQKSEVWVLKTVINLLQSGEMMTVFPEGTRYCEKIEDAKDGAVLFALKSKTPIVATKISGKFRPFGKLKIEFKELITYEEYYDKKVGKEELHSLTVELMKKIYSDSEEVKL